MFRRGQDAGFQHPNTCQHLWFVSAKGVQVSLLSMGLPPTIEVANLGMADSLILMVMALVVFCLLYTSPPEFRALTKLWVAVSPNFHSTSSPERREAERQRWRTSLCLPMLPRNGPRLDVYKRQVQGFVSV